MLRELYHHEKLHARELNERYTQLAHRRHLPPSRLGRRLAHWTGLLLVRLGACLLRYAADRHSRRLTPAR
ncbi:MAG: hypothetical protein J7456_04585 [Chloroflexus sp.]|jgi:hypothetical protein|uniref:hypothetical protein n=1 Tax=Chloroflexus sp. Y-396-1 TaxID=867845 RepID=UPI000490CBDF|nr:hypothetical protein [Chloroflexus sp. Y-396-1]MBO9310921.1 hypothetical protein [Chloroflexus sp.]MBO9315048.1 hypothetical protein [Chloroflexus sp.]MBO9320307.1 hypothetical protein [Chloroflexus sp.]MBO9339446.1 hypothetical protein [Chloroflexus sp.]